MAEVPFDATAQALLALLFTYLRVPTYLTTEDTTGEPVVKFSPPLTTAEQTTYATLLRMAKSHVTGLTLAEFTALQPALAEIRTFRTRSLATWNALTATQREADEIGYLNDITDVLRTLLRDG